MDEKAKVLKTRADEARLLYKRRFITREDAKVEVMPFIEYYNEKSKTIAKKHGVNPKFINFSSYVR